MYVRVKCFNDQIDFCGLGTYVYIFFFIYVLLGLISYYVWSITFHKCLQSFVKSDGWVGSGGVVCNSRNNEKFYSLHQLIFIISRKSNLFFFLFLCLLYGLSVFFTRATLKNMSCPIYRQSNRWTKEYVFF